MATVPVDSLADRVIERMREQRGSSYSLWPKEFGPNAEDAYRFLLGLRTWNETASSVQFFPDRDYLRAYVFEWWRGYEAGVPLCIEKCRRMVISWTARGLELYVMGLGRTDVLLGGEDYEASAKHCWRYKHFYKDLRMRMDKWKLPEHAEGRFKTERLLASFRLPNGSHASILNGEPDSVQGDGVRIIVMEEFGIYSAPASMLAQARIITQGAGGKRSGFVHLITNAATDPEWQLIKNGGQDPGEHKQELTQIMNGLECADLATGMRYLKLHHYADPDKGADWLRQVQIEMSDTPAVFRLQILMEDSETPGSIWSASDIDMHRIDQADLPDFDYICVALDPCTKPKEGVSDEHGIIVAASATLNGVRHAYVLFDASGEHDIGKCCRIVIRLATKLKANEIVYEDNQGGDWIKNSIEAEYRHQGAALHPPIKGVTVRTGKSLRAEPVAAQYTRGLVHHVIGAPLGKLENQMRHWNPLEGNDSPDRLDALVIVLTRLFEGTQQMKQPESRYNAPGRKH